MTDWSNRLSDMTDTDRIFLTEALTEARHGFDQGGVPVGAVMVRSGQIVARGRNKRVQENDPVMHGETDCLRSAGIMEDYSDTEMYTTLSPCMMCTGAILHFGIKRVVIGENINFPGNIELLLDFGVKVVLADDPACKNLIAQFIRQHPELWFEDIAGRSHT